MSARTTLCMLLPALVLASARANAQQAPAGPIAGIGPVGEIVKLHGGLQFTEGPAGDAEGNVFFSDIPASRIYRVDPQGVLSVFREPSNSTNGLMFNAAGELVGCEMEGRVVAMSRDGEVIRPLAESYQGKRFNAPNDLVIDRSGGVYFTDPHFRAPDPLPQGVTAVYYVASGGDVTRLIDDLKAPNGVILSPDEDTLYVVPSQQAEVMAYAVESPGKLGAPRVFCRLKQPPGEEHKGGDGLTVDTRGNLYIATSLGLQVYGPQGELLGIITFPESPSNATFVGPERKTLFVTARTSVYTASMEATGHVFAGK